MSIHGGKRRKLDSDDDEHDDQPRTRRGGGKRGGEAAAAAAVAASGTAAYSLKMEPGPPEFPFVNQAFELVIHLVDQDNHLKIGANLPLSLDLLYESGEPVPRASEVIQLSPTAPTIAGNGQARVQCKFLQLSLQHGGRSFQLRVTAMRPVSAMSPLGPIEAKISAPLRVVKHRLVVTEQPTTDWYKDEKGASNCMIVKGEIVDSHARRVTHSNLPLRVLLAYESNERLKDQSLISFLNLGNKKRCHVNDDGTFEIRYRISQVSSNHQNQQFCIHIEADDDVNPQHQEVSACASAPVRVWSKRNFSRGKKAETPEPEATASAAAVAAIAAAAVAATSAPSSANRRSHGAATGSQTGSSANVPPPNWNSAADIGMWARDVFDVISDVQWELIGYESEVATDMATLQPKPLYRCPSCRTIRDQLHQQTHHTDCRVKNVLQHYQSFVLPVVQQWEATAVSSSSTSSSTLRRVSFGGAHSSTAALASAAQSQRAHQKQNSTHAGGEVDGHTAAIVGDDVAADADDGDHIRLTRSSSGSKMRSLVSPDSAARAMRTRRAASSDATDSATMGNELIPPPPPPPPLPHMMKRQSSLTQPRDDLLFSASRFGALAGVGAAMRLGSAVASTPAAESSMLPSGIPTFPSGAFLSRTNSYGATNSSWAAPPAALGHLRVSLPFPNAGVSQSSISMAAGSPALSLGLSDAAKLNHAGGITPPAMFASTPLVNMLGGNSGKARSSSSDFPDK